MMLDGGETAFVHKCCSTVLEVEAGDDTAATVPAEDKTAAAEDDDDEDDDEEEVGEKSGDGSRKRKSLLSGPAPLEAQWGVSFVGGKGEMEGNGRRRMEMVTDPATHRAGTY